VVTDNKQLSPVEKANQSPLNQASLQHLKSLGYGQHGRPIDQSVPHSLSLAMIGLEEQGEELAGTLAEHLLRNPLGPLKLLQDETDLIEMLPTLEPLEAANQLAETLKEKIQDALDESSE